MAGYHNDQYFNLQAAGEDVGSGFLGISLTPPTSSGYTVKGADNPPFVYPERVIRANGESTFMKRGYIRSLVTYANSFNIQIRKCQFQFNPATLIQSVSANDSMLNFLQQDPAQYAQPMPGNVNFTFELMFDRSMELNNDQGKVSTNILNPWENADPSQVGVLRDVGAFFGVIGQGLSVYQIDYLQKVLEEQVRTEASSQSGGLTVGTGGTLTQESAVDPTKAVSNIPEFLKMNVANSAFLLPLPVRIVFSSLYIVEGLVTNTTVQFTKFSTAMVPMQCTLQVTIEAKYIGFAQKTTFLTYVLEQRELQEKAEAQASVDRLRATYAAFDAMAGTMEMAVGGNGTDAGGSGTQAHGFPSVSNSSGYLNSLKSILQSKSSAFFLHTRFPFARDASTDNVASMYAEGGTNPSISVNANLQVYGPYSNLSDLRGPQRNSVSQEDIEHYALTSVLAQRAYLLLHATLVPGTTLNGSGTASTLKEWQEMSKDVSTDIFLTDTGWQQSSPSYDADLSWFIIHYHGECHANMEGNNISGIGDFWQVIGPGADGPLSATINMTWTTPPDAIAIPGSVDVPVDNAATAPNKEGSTSKVGAPKSEPRKIRGPV